MAAKTQYCVFTVPPGQLPARLVKCFRTKKAAQKFTRRERYLQIIPRKGLGSAKKAPKTQMIYVVQGNYGYGHGWEDLTAEVTRKEGIARLREYRANENAPFRIISRRVKR
jgi:hypothetical protein